MDFSKAIPYPEGAATVNGCYSYLDCDVVIIDKYVPSRLDFEGLALAQDELPGGGTIVFFDCSYDGTLALRVPNDPSLNIRITIDGDEYSHVLNTAVNGFAYVLVSGPFEVGCRVKLEIGTGTLEAPSAPAHDPSLFPKAMRTDNGTIAFNDSRSRFFVAL